MVKILELNYHSAHNAHIYKVKICSDIGPKHTIVKAEHELTEMYIQQLTRRRSTMEAGRIN